jgi:glutamine---fructose-6-phosphate transaminase (isomerizing)
MDLKDEKQKRFALVREMMETPAIIASFKAEDTRRFAAAAGKKKALFLTGEGSSRIFPAKRAMSHAMKCGYSTTILTEGSTQALEYNLDDFAVFAASNSGQTKEVIRLVSSLRNRKHNALFGLTATGNSKLNELAAETHVLGCGKEQAVAATKSVIEQGLFYDSIIRQLNKDTMTGLQDVAAKCEEALTVKIDMTLIDRIKNADVIYFAGRNNGVAEELALKTNEITRKKSAYLEGTFAVHGIEEVMNRTELLVWIDPFGAEEDKFRDCLVKGVGMDIIAISSRPASFPTILIPDAGEYNEYVQLAAGWNLLVETGLALGIDLDKPERARKVGNEYVPE